MIKDLGNALESLLPAVICEASAEDSILSLIGEAWVLNSPSEWRVVHNGKLAYGAGDEAAPDRIWDLCGRKILSVAFQSRVMRGDPVLEISGGFWVEIFSDHPVDPWTFRTPSMFFVGSPSDPNFVDPAGGGDVVES